MQSSLAGHSTSPGPVNVGHQVLPGLLVLDLPPPLDQLLHAAVVGVLGGDGLEDHQAGQSLVLAGLKVPLLLVF